MSKKRDTIKWVLGVVLVSILSGGLLVFGTEGRHLGRSTPAYTPWAARPTHTLTPTPLAVLPVSPVASPLPETRPTASPTPPQTATPAATDTPPGPTLTPTTIGINYPPFSRLEIPILVYLHVVQGEPSRYKVTVENFRAQMEYLAREGYQTITLDRMVWVLLKGGRLPPKAVVLTFDGGYADVYENAFPIMQEYGFVGELFPVVSRLDVAGFLTTAQVQEMLDAGWGLASLSTSHRNLVDDHSIARVEILNSRLALESIFGVPVRVFAYPDGERDAYVTAKVQEYGYWAGVGYGISNTHSVQSLYYLSRREVRGDMTLEQFIGLLK